MVTKDCLLETSELKVDKVMLLATIRYKESVVGIQACDPTRWLT